MTKPPWPIRLALWLCRWDTEKFEITTVQRTASVVRIKPKKAVGLHD